MTPDVANSFTVWGFAVFAILGLCGWIAWNDKTNRSERIEREKREDHKHQNIINQFENRITEIQTRNDEKDKTINKLTKEFTNTINSNTEQLKNMVDKLEIIPKMQKDIEDIKFEMKGGNKCEDRN